MSNMKCSLSLQSAVTHYFIPFVLGRQQLSILSTAFGNYLDISRKHILLLLDF